MGVSVVIPAYNEEKFIKKCLNSLIKQSVKPAEIIVVDNNSTDRTAEIAASYSGVTLLKEKKQGIIFSRNKGFNAAKGEIIARCDADTVVEKNWIKKITKHFEDSNIDGLSGTIVYNDLPLNLGIDSVMIQGYVKVMQEIAGTNILIGPNMAITKTIWNKVKKDLCTDGTKVHEDIDVSFHIKDHKGVIVYDENLIVHTSARRILKNPQSFFINYPLMVVKMLRPHKNILSE